MARWLKKMNRWLGPHVELPETFFDDLDLLRVLNLSLSMLSQISGAKNVVWLRADESKRWQAIAKGAQALEQDQTYYQETRVKSLNSFAPTELIQALNGMDTEQINVQLFSSDGRFDVLVPVCKPTRREVIGYFILLDVLTSGVESTLKKSSQFITQAERHISFCVEHWAVKSESYHDDLTGLYNQKYLSMIVENEVHRSARNKSKFSVLFMDIDYFKAVNDSKGHLVGSKILIDLGHIILKNLRRSDYAFRYGGDEFVVVLPETPSEGALIVAERIRSVVEAHQFIIDGHQISVTLSVGIATYPDHAKSRKDILNMADQAMYHGKAKSRNIVIMAS